MKGLLVKDFQLLKENKSSILVILGIAAIFLLTQGEDSASFIVSYITLIMGMLVVTTMSYDELDHGLSFLMTLPVTRKIYVLEKYALGILCVFIGWLFSSIVVLTYALCMHADIVWIEWGLMLAEFLVIAILLVSVMIPVQFKFGGEKGRIALFSCVVVIIIVGGIIFRIMMAMGVDLESLLLQIIQIHWSILLCISMVVLAIFVMLSISISIRIMEKKQL